MKDLQELTELRFGDATVILKDNLVRSNIVPEKASELERNLIVKGNTVIEGGIFANTIEIENGDLRVEGAVYANKEIYVNTDCTGAVKFVKAVACNDSVIARASKCRLSFYSDINAKKVTLYNAFVAGSIYADEIELDNCVVIGGVFATQQINLNNAMVGTFNSPEVTLGGKIGLLLPSAFSINEVAALPNTVLYNYSLADLGALYRGAKESPNSGKIRLSLKADEVKSNLDDGTVQKQLRCYTVVGKVLAADLVETEKFQNHFLLTAASLGPQLLKVYDMMSPDGKEKATLSADGLRDFFLDVLAGRIEVQEMNGSFDISEIASRIK